jgi:hypothetical protein
MNPPRGESNEIVIGTVQSRTDYLGEQILVRQKVLFFVERGGCVCASYLSVPSGMGRMMV